MHHKKKIVNIGSCDQDIRDFYVLQVPHRLHKKQEGINLQKAKKNAFCSWNLQLIGQL